MVNETPRRLISRLTALELEMSKIPHPPASTPGQSEVLADFARKLPDTVWDYRWIDAEHVNIEGAAYDVFTLQCVSDYGSWPAPSLRIQFCLPCCRSACFCDYSGEAEMAKHVDEVIGGSLRLWFERHQS